MKNRACGLGLAACGKARRRAVSLSPGSRRTLSRRERGFTLIEVIVIVVILGVLAAVIAPRFLSRIGQSKQSVAGANASSLVTAVRLFITDHGTPEQSSTIDILWERPGNVEEAKWQPYVENPEKLLDAWGNKFILKIPGDKNTFDFDIVSYGADGKPGGEGENADIVKP
jgi:general secretion pathway protein G